MKYLAIYRNGLNNNKSISFQFKELNQITFKALLDIIRIETNNIFISDNVLIESLSLYCIDQLPIEYLASVFNTDINSNRIHDNTFIQVDMVNQYNSIDNWL